MSPPPPKGRFPGCFTWAILGELPREALIPLLTNCCTNCYWVKLKPAVTIGPRKITFESGPQYFLRVWISVFRPFTVSEYMTTNIEKSEVWCR